MKKTTRRQLINNVAAAPVMERLTFNLKGGVRHDTLEGRDCWVVPVAMLSEGVHRGSNGALFYPKDELTANVDAWNHMPIVVYHPQREGQGISARDPQVLNTQKVGVVLNALWNGKLRAEAWIEKERVAVVDKRVGEFLENSKIMEVSTGLYTTNEATEGEFKGKKYTAIARNFQPDHLALLPDQIGAYSVADGAGLLQLNAAMEDSKIDGCAGALLSDAYRLVENRAALTINGMSFQAITSAIANLLMEKYKTLTDPVSNPSPVGWNGWVEDVYKNFFIYFQAGEYFRQDYSMDKDTVSLGTDMPVQVKRVTEWRALDNTFVGNVASAVTNQETDMKTKKDKVDGLISNAATKWSEADRELLLSMNDAQIDKLDAHAAEPVAEPTTTNAAAPVVAPVAAPAVPVLQTNAVAPVAAMTYEQLVANADPATRDMLAQMRASHDTKKAELIKTITGNALNKFEPAFLQTQNLQTLEGIAALAAAPAAAPQILHQSYAGQATPALQTNAGVKVEALVSPVLNFDKA